MPRGAGQIDIPPDWADSVCEIHRRRSHKVLVIGASDRGKSTYCRYLLSELLRRGEDVAFVDADIGQKDVGPPATITLGYPEKHASSEWRLGSLYFVGSITPAGHLLQVLTGTARMVAEANCTFAVVDSIGWITGAGELLQHMLIDLLDPDAIVALELDGELEALYRSHRHRRVFRLSVSPRLRRKSSAARLAARARAFRQYFSSSHRMRISVSDLVVQNAPLPMGDRNVARRFRNDEKQAARIVASLLVNEKEPVVGVPAPSGVERGLLCGIAAREGKGLGIGMVEEINLRKLTLDLLTPVPRRLVEVVRFGDLYVDRAGNEYAGRKSDAAHRGKRRRH